ncbi:hypothetical protein [Arcanobacterium ihumii]|uniref:hypothetical protein n=1 Tax=Arcanobacterium ihumii TaxID=2138162 RepID=UPI000F523F5D|nr:hypothetical protein [Arcanobacterium ihumii]
MLNELYCAKGSVLLPKSSDYWFWFGVLIIVLVVTGIIVVERIMGRHNVRVEKKIDAIQEQMNIKQSDE